MLTINDALPNFIARAFHNGKDVEIEIGDKKYKDKWLVFIFYPADFTFICPTELEETAKRYDDLKKLGAEVFCVSTDTVFVHKAWHENSPAIAKVKFPMIADPTGELCRLFGTYIPAGGDAGLSLRGSFIVDPDRVLKVIHLHDNSVGRSIDELYRALEAAKFTREHKGQVCPASWKPGAKTLKPGMHLVGKL